MSSEFNQLICEKIKDQPAPFIYERIGEKFRHYFIDEMQDTSSLQWQNLIPLINNALSQEKGSLLLVGDAKQAIYRWRGGKAERFIDLSEEGNTIEKNPFLIQKTVQNLNTNHRSFSEIIKFNDSFFSHISDFFNGSIYENLYKIPLQKKGENRYPKNKEGGFVQLNFMEAQSAEERQIRYNEKTLEIIKELDTRTKKSDICILVRKKKEGIAIADYLSEKGIQTISSETLLLKNSPKVQCLISTLTYIKNPIDKNSKFKILSFLYDFFEIDVEKHLFYKELIDLEINDFFIELRQHNISFDLKKILQKPFYESIEEIIRAFKLIETMDVYVQSFLDFALDFHRKKTYNPFTFLEIWEQKKDVLSISSPENEDAVQIMTIHKSKGLEFKVVLFPCDLKIKNEIKPTLWYEDLDPKIFGRFNSFLISFGENIKLIENGNKLFKDRKEEVALDNFNLIYVSLTRAVKELYIITVTDDAKKVKEIKEINSFSGLLVNYLDFKNIWDANKKTYEFGNKTVREPKEENLVEKKSKKQSFISIPWDNHDIYIVSNSSKNWEILTESKTQYGLLIHEILSKIITIKDVDKVVSDYVFRGIVTEDRGEKILEILKNVVNHKKIAPYFEENIIVFNERAILNKDNQILIPDRIVLKGDTLTIIDYKTGVISPEHKVKMNEYADTLTEIGFRSIKKMIIYIKKQLRVEIL